MKLHRFLLAAVLAAAASAVFAADDLSGVNVYPNPARAAYGQNAVVFDKLTTRVDLRIYDANGILVREAAQDDPSGQYVWDLTNGAGAPVAGGVYFYRLSTPSGDKRSGKLAVIR